MAENKTTENENSVTDFINAVDDERKRKDSFRIVELFEQQTGLKAKMWGTAIIGVGSYHYKYDSGREGDMPLAGFSPRKNAISFYIGNFPGRETMLESLGKHTMSKACIYVKKLDDIDEEILKKIISASVEHTKKTYH